MKLKWIALLLLMGLTCTSVACRAQSKGIRFTDSSWAALLAAAKQSGKLIFMDAYTTWCGPCKWMKANVFTEEKVGDLYNRNFINAYIDMEKGEGLALRKQYGIRAYPTALYINGDGEVVHKTVGQCSAADFMQHALDALSPRRNLQYLETHYAERSKDIEFVTTYLNALKQAYDPEACNKIALEYLQGRDSTSWLQSSNWLLLQEYVTDATSPVFNYLVRHQLQFSALYGAKAVEAKIYGTYQDWPAVYVSYPVEGGDPVLDKLGFAHFLSQLANSSYERKEEIAGRAKLTVYFRLRDWNLYAGTVSEMLAKSIIPMDPRGAEWLYVYADNIHRFAKSNPSSLAAATGWAKIITDDIQGVSIQKRATYLELYASLLEATGNKRLAKQTRKKIDTKLLSEAQKANPFQQMRIIPKQN